MENKKFSEITENKKMYNNTYWGQFKLDETHNKYEDFKEIFENRNKFINDYNIVKNVKKSLKNIEKYIKHLENNKIRLDHVECYLDKNGNYIFVNSPYTSDETLIKGFDKIYKLYANEAITFIKITSKEEIKNEMKVNKTKKEIMKDFYNKHLETYTCEICLGKYKYFNKYHHLKTGRHLKFLEIKNNK